MTTTYQASLGEYQLDRKLGNGQFSKVRVAHKDGKEFAAKYMVKSNDLMMNKTYLDLVFTEAKIMSQLDHPNIVKLFDFNDSGDLVKKQGSKHVPVLYLIFELITGGEIFDYIAVGGRFSDKMARWYFGQILSALEFMHSKGFAHRDIKAENVLMDENFNLKLADFGFSSPMAGKDGSGKMHTYKGTLGYMAPEILMNQAYAGDKVDLFAAGVLLFIMIAQHPPFRQATAKDPYYKMFCQQNETFWNKMSGGKPPGTLTPQFKSLINGLLSFDPNKRPSIAEIKLHPFMQGPAPAPMEIAQEFLQRRMKVQEEWKAKREEALKKKHDKKKGFQGGFDPHTGTKAGMGPEMQLKMAVKKNMEVYCAKDHCQTMLFSVLDPNDIMNGVKGVFTDMKCSVKESETHYGMQIGMVFMGGEPFEFEMKLEKVDDDVTAMKFLKKEGSQMDFLEMFNKVRQDLTATEIAL